MFQYQGTLYTTRSSMHTGAHMLRYTARTLIRHVGTTALSCTCTRIVDESQSYGGCHSLPLATSTYVLHFIATRAGFGTERLGFSQTFPQACGRFGLTPIFTFSRKQPSLRLRLGEPAESGCQGNLLRRSWALHAALRLLRALPSMSTTPVANPTSVER
jgi:hypothetical protein